MNRDVFKHILHAHGKRPGIWLSAFTELFRSIIIRVVAVIILADMVAYLAIGDNNKAKFNIVLYGVLAIVSSILYAIGELAGQKAENRQYLIHSRLFYDELTNKDMSFYRDNQSGYLASSYRQYVDGSILLIRFLRTEVIRTTISMTVPVAILYTKSVLVGLTATVIVASQVIYIRWSSSKSQKYRDETHEVHRALTGEVADVVTNIVAYKSSGHETQSKKKFIKMSAIESNAFWNRRKINTLFDLPRNVFTYALATAALWLAVQSSQNSVEAVSFLTATMIYTFQILRNVSDIPGNVDRYEDLATKIYPALQILQGSNKIIKDPTNPEEFTVNGGSIEFSKVNFSYPNNGSIFSNFDLSVKGGEKVGIVGLSGAGKSTLAGLLMRFDDVVSGSIAIDGQNISSVRQTDLRAKISYVPQEPLLFHRTVRENISYMNTSATESEIVKAAKAAHAHEFIQELPDGYDTVVGERGIKLSGGQKQRIVIARAVLKNAPIILFDEATSALDSESEHIIQKALPEIIGKHTAIIIAHRLSTVAGLDRIVVMHDGKIEEQGTHSQLLAKKGRYYRLWQKQTVNNT